MENNNENKQTEETTDALKWARDSLILWAIIIPITALFAGWVRFGIKGGVISFIIAGSFCIVLFSGAIGAHLGIKKEEEKKNEQQAREEARLALKKQREEPRVLTDPEEIRKAIEEQKKHTLKHY